MLFRSCWPFSWHVCWLFWKGQPWKIRARISIQQAQSRQEADNLWNADSLCKAYRADYNADTDCSVTRHGITKEENKTDIDTNQLSSCKKKKSCYKFSWKCKHLSDPYFKSWTILKVHLSSSDNVQQIVMFTRKQTGWKNSKCLGGQKWFPGWDLQNHAHLRKQRG